MIQNLVTPDFVIFTESGGYAIAFLIKKFIFQVYCIIITVTNITFFNKKLS